MKKAVVVHVDELTGDSELLLDGGSSRTLDVDDWRRLTAFTLPPLVGQLLAVRVEDG